MYYPFLQNDFYPFIYNYNNIPYMDPQSSQKPI